MPLANPRPEHLQMPYAQAQALIRESPSPPGGRPPYGPGDDHALYDVPAAHPQHQAPQGPPPAPGMSPLAVAFLVGGALLVGKLAYDRYLDGDDDFDDEDDDDGHLADRHYARNASVRFVESEDEDD